MHNVKFMGYGARICELPGTCKYSSMLLKDWCGNWVFRKPTLVIGGGAGKETMNSIINLKPDTPTTRSTSVRSFGFSSIHRIVSRGGVYIGICNGAYIAGKEVRYDDYEGTRVSHYGLGLLCATTLGPVYPRAPGSNITITDSFGQPHSVWYQKGGTFPQNIHSKKLDYKVHAIYHDESFPAIVSFRYGKGTVILSGVHPEHTTTGSIQTYRLFNHIFKSRGLIVNNK